MDDQDHIQEDSMVLIQKEKNKVPIETLTKNIRATVNKAVKEKKHQRISYNDIKFYSRLLHFFKQDHKMKFSADMLQQKMVDPKNEFNLKLLVDQNFKIDNLEECQVVMKQPGPTGKDIKMVKRLRKIDQEFTVHQENINASFQVFPKASKQMDFYEKRHQARNKDPDNIMSYSEFPPDLKFQPHSGVLKPIRSQWVEEQKKQVVRT
jgi:hypothetical protein